MKGKAILIIEDDDDVRTTLAELLLVYGHEVHEACHGQDALDKLSSIPVPALIFLDAMMPVMDGPTFFRHMKKMETHAAVPVILFSAVDSKLDLPGVSARLRKPADLNDILKIVEKYCGE